MINGKIIFLRKIRWKKVSTSTLTSLTNEVTSARLTKKKKKDKFSSKNNYLIYFNIYSHLFPVVFHQFAKSIDFCRGFAAVHFEVRPKLQTSSEITEKSIIDIEIYKNF